MSEQPEFYYDLATGEIQEGKVAGWTSRMGPYPSAEAARHAMDKVRTRNEEWEEDDAAWKGEPSADPSVEGTTDGSEGGTTGAGGSPQLS